MRRDEDDEPWQWPQPPEPPEYGPFYWTVLAILVASGLACMVIVLMLMVVWRLT